jgi:hypothetical protein
MARSIAIEAGVAFVTPEEFPDLADRQDLVGVDVSASQFQINAVFLGITELEAQLKERSFKEIASERVRQRDRDRRDTFTLPRDYEDDTDPQLREQLRESLKRAALTYMYGSSPREIERTLAKSVSTYGPGLGSGANIRRFLDDEALNLGDIERWWMPLCRLAAKTACERDPFAGLVVTDPFDGASQRWNPVAWKIALCAGADEVRIYAKVPLVRSKGSLQPAAPNAAGDYPVDRDQLKRMVGPCLTQMLDASFAGYVIEGLSQVISTHDAWAVPLDAADALAKAVDAAGEPWLRGLRVVYDDLLKYLPSKGKDAKYATWLRDRKELWAARVARADWPKFRVGDVRLVEMATE